MDSSDKSSLDDLVARSTVQDFGRFRYVLAHATRNSADHANTFPSESIVKVPGWSTLTKLEKFKTCAKVEYESRNPSDWPGRVKLM